MVPTRFIALLIVGGCLSNLCLRVHAQQEIGFIERFAIAADRRQALAELIPGTEDYYYFHCLHYQNERQLAEAQSMLEQWKSRFGEHPKVMKMMARQMLLSYDQAPKATLDYLRDRLGVELNHAAPSRDRAAAFDSRLDPARLDPEQLIEAAINRDRSLNQIATRSLPQLVNRPLAPEQLRSWLRRLERADFAGLVKRIAEELALRDSAGFGWAPVHQLLTLDQLEELLKLQPRLIEHEAFLRSYVLRLVPADGAALEDPRILRSYLERLAKFVRTLPPSQNSLKALVLGNLLQLNLRESQMDRELFLEYLAIPRSAIYYIKPALGSPSGAMADLAFVMSPQILLPPIGNDSALVRKYLEHFFAAEERLDDFARFLDRDYLERVLAETKILNGAAEASAWYAKLNPAEQKALRERVELRFGPQNKTVIPVDEDVKLSLTLKNVSQLIVKIYQVNPRNYYRGSSRPISTDIDLDGLVANAERQLEYNHPADRRHTETLALPELDGRGIWVIDLLGGGQRSRAIIQKGGLTSLQQPTDAGHMLQILDAHGQIVKSAHVEMDGRAFRADSSGRVLIPYSETTKLQDILLVDGDFATPEKLTLQQENYRLQAGFVVDHQTLLAGTKASVLIRSNLDCNGRPVSLSLLEKAQLTIVATDIDGISTTQTTGDIKLSDSQELIHTFLVPQRLVSIRFTLSGRVAKQSRDERQDVAASQEFDCNAITRSNVIGGFFLREGRDGYRLLVLGRNGEPIGKLPVSITAVALDVTSSQSFNLATNIDGELELGKLTSIASVSFAAQGVHPSTVRFDRASRAWPSVQHASTKSTLVLPLGVQTADSSLFSLTELRRGAAYRRLPEHIHVEEGQLRIEPLEAGNYLLVDHQLGQRTQIAVVDATADTGSTGFLVGATRLLEATPRQPLAIAQAQADEESIRVKLSGHDAHTRVHILANPFVPDLDPLSQIRLSDPPSAEMVRRRPSSLYVDSLTLDEEYSYILRRQQVTKYPGNMLAQPSLLVHPWEISLTENQTKDAALGSAMPSDSDAMASPEPMAAEHAKMGHEAAHQSNSYDFLAKGTLLVGNLMPNADGEIVVPIANLGGHTSIVVLAVHPTGTDSRNVTLPLTPLVKRDLRLKESFPPESHLLERQTVRRLEANAKAILGDAKTSRFQLYTTLSDVFGLYGTLLNNPEWEKFRFVTEWPQLTDVEKRAKYSQMSCHELDFFLFHKDRNFFDKVVAPLIAQKLDKQLVDQWLLEKSLDGYRRLWRMDRLNTLERLLLAQRSAETAPAIQRWLDEYLLVHPLPVETRRVRFETALRGTLLDAREADLLAVVKSASPASAAMRWADGGSFGGMGERKVQESLAEPQMAADKLARGASPVELFFDFQSMRSSGGAEGKMADRFFQSLDQTREWAETQFYHVRLQNQTPELIPPSDFWQEYLRRETGMPFLSSNLDQPVNTINEALCALAVLDLPFDQNPAELSVENDRLAVTTKQTAVAYVQSVETAEDSDVKQSLLVGRDVYLADLQINDENNLPVQSQPMLVGVPYRATIVVTNPGSGQKRVQVLSQLPAGAIALGGSKATKSTTVELNPYSSGQVHYVFYFPEPGQFNHYGGQVSNDGKHLIATASESHKVLAEPESVDESTWSYLADWGTNDQVLAYLQKANLQRIELGRIAFRLHDKSMYEKVIALLSRAARFDATLWGYAIKHDDAENIAQLLQVRRDFSGPLGPVLDSRLLRLDPREQMSYEHLDYKPLVVARIHQLGPKRLVLNDRLFAQYSRLLEVLSCQGQISDEQRMELCYYMLLQNRIEEALTWFGRVSVEELTTRLQYDYFAAYLDFFRGEYDHANEIARRYAAYPVPSWRDLFAQIVDQLRQRQAMISGQEISSVTSLDSGLDRDQRIFSEQREAQQTRQAAESPGLDLSVNQGLATIQFRNLDRVQINYYLMDIELLFSRNPFVSQNSDRLPAIRPNVSETLSLPGGGQTLPIELPPEVRNRNVLIEVTAKGISRSSVLTANSLAVTVTEPYGRVQVRSQADRLPVEAAYVKVYARQRDGSIRFFKDGYTDLRGQFDYATLSTSDLNSTERLAILVIDPKHGALVREALPPTR